MPEITPAPRAGSWLEVVPYGGPFLDQPRAGTWLEVVPRSPSARRKPPKLGLGR